MFEVQEFYDFISQRVVPLGGIAAACWALFVWGKSSAEKKIKHFDEFVFNTYLYPQVLSPWAVAVNDYCTFLNSTNSPSEDRQHILRFQASNYETSVRLLFLKSIDAKLYSNASKILSKMEDCAVETLGELTGAGGDASRKLIKSRASAFLHKELIAFIACVTLIKGNFTLKKLATLQAEAIK